MGKASISAHDLTAIAREINTGINTEINAGINTGTGRPTLSLPNGVTLQVLSFSDAGNTVTGYGVGRIVLNPALHLVGQG